MQDLDAMFSLFDPTDRGYISLEQYHNGEMAMILTRFRVLRVLPFLFTDKIPCRKYSMFVVTSVGTRNLTPTYLLPMRSAQDTVHRRPKIRAPDEQLRREVGVPGFHVRKHIYRILFDRDGSQ